MGSGQSDWYDKAREARQPLEDFALRLREHVGALKLRDFTFDQVNVILGLINDPYAQKYSTHRDLNKIAEITGFPERYK